MHSCGIYSFLTIISLKEIFALFFGQNVRPLNKLKISLKKLCYIRIKWSNMHLVLQNTTIRSRHYLLLITIAVITIIL